MSTTFSDLGLPDKIVNALSKKGITEPFPVQAATIPDAMAGKDVCGKAPTGSGKTFAFGLPVIARVGVPNKNRPRALILAPTRELAEQIKDELAPIGALGKRRVFAVYGGVGYGPQLVALRNGLDVLVATPGRLEDLMEKGAIKLDEVEMVVVDEADRMADMGFLPAVKRILSETPETRQTLLFSATLDGDVAVLVRDFQKDPVRHEAGSIDPDTVEARHHFWLVDRDERTDHTAALIESTGRAIVFTRTRRGADRLSDRLGKTGTKASPIHGGLSQNARKRALQDFSSGRVKALIATDVAARGIHIDAVACVVHYDPPEDHKDYLHRSGRTARAGAAGGRIPRQSAGRPGPLTQERGGSPQRQEATATEQRFQGHEARLARSTAQRSRSQRPIQQRWPQRLSCQLQRRGRPAARQPRFAAQPWESGSKQLRESRPATQLWQPGQPVQLFRPWSPAQPQPPR